MAETAPRPLDRPSAEVLLSALSRSGRDPAAPAAPPGLPEPGSPGFCDWLYVEGFLTNYQHKKLRLGRVAEIVFGPYLILDKLGEGGMGKVYRAAQLDDSAGGRPGRVVALKIVRAHLLANPVVRKRYEREAAAAAVLKHPNIVALFGAAEISGRPYLAMEYVDGIDLSRLMREFGSAPSSGLPTFQECAEYVRQAALGLQHAHDMGFVHRDIKPANVLVCGDRALPGAPHNARVKILDMGLVRSLEPDEHSMELTRENTVVGTPDYMSPEQAKNSSTIDARSDQYSLGCTLYYLLRGQAPFPTGTPIEKLIRHQTEAVPSIRHVRPDVPEGLAAVLTKLLQKKPELRYRTAAEAATALEPFTRPDGAVPVYEPFNFSDDPTAVMTPETDADFAPPAPPDAAPEPARPATVRLRVKATAIPSPKPLPPSGALPVPAAPRTARPARTPVSILSVAIPKPESSPSSSELSTRSARMDRPRTPVATRRPAPAVGWQVKLLAYWWVLAGALALLAVLVLLVRAR